jgi:hypothetical protein
MGFIDRVKALFGRGEPGAEAVPALTRRFRVKETGETVEGLALSAPLSASFGQETWFCEPGDVLVDLGADGIRVLRADEVE